MDYSHNPWQTISTREIYDNPWIRVVEDNVINPAGGKGIYGKVLFKNKAVGVIPLDEDNNTWLVGQYRYTLNQWSWEIPEGGGALQSDPLEAAKRELEEETGLIAATWTEIATAHLSNSVSDEEGYVFLAEGITEGRVNRDDTEADMQVRKLPASEAVAMVLRGEITDSLSVIGLLKLALLRNIR